MATYDGKESGVGGALNNWVSRTGVVLVSMLLSMLTAHAANLPGFQAKVSVQSITVEGDNTLPPEVRALQAATAHTLFDRDTTVPYTTYGTTRIRVRLDRIETLRAIKVFGNAGAILNVSAGLSGQFTPIKDLQNLRLASLSNGWNRFDIASGVRADSVLFEFREAQGVAAAASLGLTELEIWSAKGRETIGDATELVGMIDDDRAPLHIRDFPANDRQVRVGAPTDVTIPLDHLPAQLKHAWLAYEVYGLEHWVSVKRSINGLTARGGDYRFAKRTWTTQVEPIAPRWLQSGDNTITFTVPDGLTGVYLLRNIRLIGALEDGSNFVEDISSPSHGDAVKVLRDGDLATGWRPYLQVTGNRDTTPVLELPFDKTTAIEGLSLYLKGNLAGLMEVDFKQGDQWLTANTNLGARQLVAGWNHLPLQSPGPVNGVRLSFKSGTSSTGEITELQLMGSGTGLADQPGITVGYPDAGQHFGRTAYLRGFVHALDNGSGPGQLFIGGKEFPLDDGGFSVVVAKDEVGYAGTPDSAPWDVKIEVLYPDGQRVTRIVQLTGHGNAARTQGRLVQPQAGNHGKIVNDEAALEMDPDALDEPKNIKITPLSEDQLPPLDPGMTNVTKGPRAGYRFTPHGLKFKKKVRIKLPYDKAKLPPCMTVHDINTYFFDEEAGRWVLLEREMVDEKTGEINSLTDHFTDMINATLTVPEHPQAVNFNPTQIKDIKAADPGAGINLIEPPQANNMGDARLGYPIEIPPGRKGMQPQLAIQYNSSGGNGWLGLGWDLAVPSITIDTRWGVPRYSATHETETYLLNGQQLSPIAHRGELLPRQNGQKLFHFRTEGSFQKIVRHGNGPSDYWWEVTDKSGTRHIYGLASTEGKSVTLQDDAGNIFRWALVMSVDRFGNYVKYNYHLDIHTGMTDGTVPGHQLYIDTIEYTGFSRQAEGSSDTADLDPPYTIHFARTESRPDPIIDGRGGLKQVTARLLDHIDITFNGSMVRRYQLDYRTGAFGKTLLQDIQQQYVEGDDPPKVFHTHQFDYYQDLPEITHTNENNEVVFDGYEGFRSTTQTVDNSYTFPTDPSEAPAGHPSMIAEDLPVYNFNYSALGGTSSDNVGFNAYFGIGTPFNYKNFSAGASSSYSRGKSIGRVALMDVDGDGLADKVFKDGGLKYFKNTTVPGSGIVSFSDTLGNITGVTDFSRSRTRTRTYGTNGFAFGATGSQGISMTTTTQDVYISDINGDGLPDVVSKGAVKFNTRSSGNGDIVDYDANAFETVAPIGGGIIEAANLIPDFSAERQALEDNNPLMDALRHWRAPYAGKIRITGTVQLADTRSERADIEYDTADGVRVTIQKNGAEQWEQVIGADVIDAFSHDLTLQVEKDDNIYFRVNSVYDGAYDTVNWSPTIEFVDSGDEPLVYTDVNNLNALRFQSAEDMVYGGRQITMAVPYDGTVRFTAQLEKSAELTDDVRISVFVVKQIPGFDNKGKRIFTEEITQPFEPIVIARNATSLDPIDKSFPVEAQNGIRIRMEADSPIDFQSIKWGLPGPDGERTDLPRLFYTEASRDTVNPEKAELPEIDENTEITNTISTTKPEDKPRVAITEGDLSGEQEDTNPATLEKVDIPVTDGDDNYIIDIPVSYDMDIYSEARVFTTENTELPRTHWTAPHDGYIYILPRFAFTYGQCLFYSGDCDTEPVIDAPDDVIVATVKKRGKLLAKKEFQSSAFFSGFPDASYNNVMLIQVNSGDELFFDISVKNQELAHKIDKAELLVGYGTSTQWKVPLTDTISIDHPVVSAPDNDGDFGAPVFDAGLFVVRDGANIKYAKIMRYSIADPASLAIEKGEHLSYDFVDITNMSLGSTSLWNTYATSSTWTAPAADAYAFVPDLDFGGSTEPAGGAHLSIKRTGFTNVERDFHIANGEEDIGPANPIVIDNVHDNEVLRFVYSTKSYPMTSFLQDKGAVKIARIERVYQSVPENQLSITPVLSLAAGETPNGLVLFQVWKDNQIASQQNITISDGVISGAHNVTMNASGTGLAFTYVVSSAALADKIAAHDVRVEQLEAEFGQTPEVVTLTATLNTYDTRVISFRLKIKTPVRESNPNLNTTTLHYALLDNLWGIPYRGWSYGAYNAKTVYDPEDPEDEGYKRAENPISEGLLIIRESESAYESGGAAAHDAYVALGDIAIPGWVSQDNLWFVDGVTMASSRYGEDYIQLPEPGDFTGEDRYVGAHRVTKVSKGRNINLGGGYYLSMTNSFGTSDSHVDVIDVNGDRYPDIIGKGNVQYTLMNGSLESATHGFINYRKSEERNTSFTLGPVSTKETKSGPNGEVVTQPKKNSQNPMPNIAFGSSDTNRDLMDINGDGLPDLLIRDGGNLYVRLNLGYKFAPSEKWGHARISEGSNRSVGLSGSLSGWASWNASFSGGLSGSLGDHQGESSLQDINGDGLLDYVKVSGGNIRVKFNTGAGFTSDYVWANALTTRRLLPEGGIDQSNPLFLSDGASAGLGININKSWAWEIVVAFVPVLELNFTVGANKGWNASRVTTTLQDINGDGLTDSLRSLSTDEVEVRLNQVGRTNMLREVKRPLGASFTIGYKQLGNTFDLPQSKWVMDKVEVEAGKPSGNDTVESATRQVMTFDYQDGKHDRYEREFLGFSRVRSTQYAEQGYGGSNSAIDGLKPYRRTLQTFLNNNIFEKGLMTSSITGEVVGDIPASGDHDIRRFVMSSNEYDFTSLGNQATVWSQVEFNGLNRVDITGATIFPRLIRTSKAFYEGQAESRMHTYTDFSYDEYGNIVALTDHGNVTSLPAPGYQADEDDDEVHAVFTYTGTSGGSHPACDENYIVGLPDSIKVYAGTSASGTPIRERSGTFDCATGALTEQRAVAANENADDAESPVTNLHYDDYGNLRQVTGPENDASQRLILSFSYDSATQTYPTVVSNDSFGYESCGLYDQRWGKPTRTTDINGNTISFGYDDFGRNINVRRKLDGDDRCDAIASGEDNPSQNGIWEDTIAFEYLPYVNLDQAFRYSYAVTRHADRIAPYGTPDQPVYSYSEDPIETVLFTDGLKRVLQTKKDASVRGEDKMVVSGRVVFDTLGRVIKQYYPTAAVKDPSMDPVSDGDLVFLTALPADTNGQNLKPTVMTYDLLDRNLETTLPDLTKTRIEYGFGTDAYNATRFQTTVKDGNNVTADTASIDVYAGASGKISRTVYGSQKVSYRDVRELITTIEENNRSHTGATGETLVTKYVYDALKQITEVLDHNQNKTEVKYDGLGRRVEINNPDTGPTTMKYDAAGNLTEKRTARLQTGEPINYDYDHNRLTGIRYPNFQDNNVLYEYGANTDDERALNRVGRIAFIKHQSGLEERQYGLLGEVTREIKSISAAANGQSKVPTYATGYHFDAFGRLLTLQLPDGELINHLYDSGGNVKRIEGTFNGSTYAYLQNMVYDEFEQRVEMLVGNGVKTTYDYDASTRRLHHLESGVDDGRAKMQELTYSYDNVGNILSLYNEAPIPARNDMGGPGHQVFEYDSLYRLRSATGEYNSAHETHTYTLAMDYNEIHNITRKTQVHKVIKNGGKEQVQRGTTYDWAYAYATGENAVRPHAPLRIGIRDETTGNIAGRSYTYDANGNQQGWTSDTNGTRRNIVWDDENRIMEVQDPRNTEKYYYDDQGQRQVRRAKYGETAYVNQFFVVRNGAISSTHIYAGNTRIATKLNAGTPVGEDTVVIWPTNNPDAQPQAGTLTTQTLQGSTSLTTLSTDTTDRTRTTGNQGNAFAVGPTDRTGPQGLPHTGENPGLGRERRSEQGTLHAQDTVKNPTLTGQLPGNRGNGNGPGPGQGNGNGNGADNGNNGGNGNGNGQGPGQNNGNGHNPDHTPGTGNGGGIGSGSGGNGGGNGTGTGSTGTTTGAGQEFLYYYHPDHLGSSSYVTDKNAKRYEHIEYFPFGETWVEESSNTWRTPYLFTSKEMDPQTKLYYFGARYYDPRTSVWQSADPILPNYLPSSSISSEDRLPGFGGVYTSANLNIFGYSHQNPVIYKDPDGRVLGKVVKEALQYGAVKLTGRALKNARNRAVSWAWKMEQQLVLKTGKGTRNWTKKELEELKKTGKVEGYEGHHINSAAKHPDQAGNPDNIKFVKKGDEHLAEHKGAYQNESTGELLDRTDNGNLPRLANEQGYQIGSSGMDVGATLLGIGAGILNFGADVAEAADLLDPMTYLFHMDEASDAAKYYDETPGATWPPAEQEPSDGD